ncbi:MAG: FAD:protein FMN transferase [Vicinamibacterales bacterium]
MVRVQTFSLSLLLAAAVFFGSACAQPEAPARDVTASAAHLIERSHETMGTRLEVSAWTDGEDGAASAFDAVFREFDRLDALMSVWQPGSDIVRLNEAAGDHPVPVSAETIEVIAASRRVSDWTDGKFDVTFAALSGLWRFDHQDKNNRIPDRAAVTERLPLIDYRDLVVDTQAGTAFLRRKGMRVNLGGVGKGYAVDRAADILRSRGLRDFMIQFGGDLYVGGLRDGRPWRLGVRDPRGPKDRSFAMLDLSDGTFSTSGDYERFFIEDGRRYHHIIDPDTGEPANLCRSVTIVANRALLADAIDTGVFLLGPEAGMALIERLPDVEGVIVTAENKVLVSSGLRNRLTVVAPPTDAP